MSITPFQKMVLASIKARREGITVAALSIAPKYSNVSLRTLQRQFHALKTAECIMAKKRGVWCITEKGMTVLG